jgi:CRISPR-associated protein Csd2
MSILKNKIDFAALVSVRNANPNGDPLNGNRPRTTYTGNGEISDVCIKRKIRNRLQDMGEKIFVQSNDRSDDGYTSLSERASKTITEYSSNEEYAKKACQTWFDVRAFGQVFAFKSKDKDEDGVSVGVRGPVTVHQAISISPVDINSMQITKSVNSEPGEKKGSDTMGSKHMVEFGLYLIKGSINVHLAEKTGFTEEDADKIKECLRNLFVNDCSSARPDGSMEVIKIYWWKHNNKTGQYSSAKVHRSLEVNLKDGVSYPSSIDDYEIRLLPLEGLEPEIIDGV